MQIGVEPMEGGSGRKLNVPGFLRYLDQEKFRLTETIYVSCTKAGKLLYCDVKAKCPQMRELGNTQTVADDEWQH